MCTDIIRLTGPLLISSLDNCFWASVTWRLPPTNGGVCSAENGRSGRSVKCRYAPTESLQRLSQREHRRRTEYRLGAAQVENPLAASV